MKKTIIKGTKVFLRRPTDEDFAEFSAAAKASRKFHRGLTSPPVERKSFEEYLARNDNPVNEDFLICRAEDCAIAGTIALSQIFRKAFQNAYLGYLLFERYTKQGLATEAVALVLKYSFAALKIHRVEANVQPENTGSIRILERNGFRLEGFSPKYLKIGGRWRDHERWAITIEDWKISNKNK